MALKWERLVDGSHYCEEIQVMLDRTGMDTSIMVTTPAERDSNFHDGWHWCQVVSGDLDQPSEFWNLPSAKAWVAEHLDLVAKYRAPDYDGDVRALAQWRYDSHQEWIANSGLGTPGKRTSTKEPLTEHDVAERLDKAAVRTLKILMDVRQMDDLMERVKRSRYHSNCLNALAAELQNWGIEPDRNFLEI